MARPQGDWTDAPTPEYRQRMRDALEQRIRDFNREHPNPPPKGNAFDKVTEALNRELKQQVADIIAEKTGTTLDARNAALRDNLEAAAENGAA